MVRGVGLFMDTICNTIQSQQVMSDIITDYNHTQRWAVIRTIKFLLTFNRFIIVILHLMMFYNSDTLIDLLS